MDYKEKAGHPRSKIRSPVFTSLAFIFLRVFSEAPRWCARAGTLTLFSPGSVTRTGKLFPRSSQKNAIVFAISANEQPRASDASVEVRVLSGARIWIFASTPRSKMNFRTVSIPEAADIAKFYENK